MRIPKQELPDVDWVKGLAEAKLPRHYRLIDVRCELSPSVDDIPEAFEIVIEYENTIDPSLKGSLKEFQQNEAWAHPLMAEIRREWPPRTVRISFLERSQ